MNDRPLGVSILAVLHILNGLGMILVGLYGLSNYSKISTNLDSVGISTAAFVLGLAILTGLMIASGIGMAVGTRWGWWCATFYYVYDIARKTNVLVTNLILRDELSPSTRGPEFEVLKFIIQTTIALAILLYFFRPHIREYFGVEDVHPGKAIGLMIGATILVASVVNGFQFVLGG